ncbi:hypothetical protein Tco_1227376 [Tanacetum coccineum]
MQADSSREIRTEVQSTESHKQSTQSHKYEDEREADRQQIQTADNSNSRLRQIRIQTADRQQIQTSAEDGQTNARRRNYPNNI